MGAQHKSAGRVSPETVDRIMKLYEKNKLSYAKIAERLCVSARTVSRIVKRVQAMREAEKLMA